MNETFGKRIYRLRKSANMTQKELANLLGISEPAVCKWETDSSMPDIMLLTPLARALHTDLNTLFSYEATLSPEQVKAFADAAEGISIAEGTDAATQYWTERLQEYPNCELLQMAYVKWLMKLQIQRAATEEQLHSMEEQLLKLSTSEVPEIKSEAQRYLASYYITTKKYEEAEVLLATLPYYDFNARHLTALLLQQKQEYDAARKESEQFLFECVQNALIALSRLASIAAATKEPEKELAYAEEMCRLEKELGIPFYRGSMQLIGCFLQAGEIEKAAECFTEYVENMVHAEECLKSSSFLGDLGEDARFISNGTLVSLNDFREELVQIMQNPAFLKPLCESEKFQQSMEKLQSV